MTFTPRLRVIVAWTSYPGLGSATIPPGMFARFSRAFAVTLLVVGLVVVTGRPSTPESSSGPEISNFAIEPPFAWSNGPARIRFDFRGAEGGLRTATLLAKPDIGTWR